MEHQTPKIRHDKSQKDYPFLQLEEDEFVELEFSRATICTVVIWVLAVFASVLLVAFLAIFNSTAGSNFLISASNATAFANLIGLVFLGLVLISALITTHVFRGNRLFITNKRAIQFIALSLFGNSINIIDLSRIEDVSFHQSGFLEHVFGIGTIRMSTVGDETTYTFKYAYKPSPKEMHTLTNLVSTHTKQHAEK